MSDNIWMLSVADDKFKSVDIEQTFYTLIPSRFPTIDVFARVANYRGNELAEIESMTNPRLRERDRLLNGTKVVDNNGPLLQNWNHAPFTYPNPEGSRFFGQEQPVLDLASDIQTALAISIGKREMFLARTNEAALGLEMREIKRTVKGRFADGREWNTNLDISERYRIGLAVRDAGFDGLLYRSIERSAGYCICTISGKVLDRAIQGAHFKFVWDGKRVSKIYAFGSGREYHPDELRGTDEVLAA